MKVKCLL